MCFVCLAFYCRCLELYSACLDLYVGCQSLLASCMGSNILTGLCECQCMAFTRQHFENHASLRQGIRKHLIPLLMDKVLAKTLIDCESLLAICIGRNV